MKIRHRFKLEQKGSKLKLIQKLIFENQIENSEWVITETANLKFTYIDKKKNFFRFLQFIAFTRTQRLKKLFIQNKY